MAQGLRSTPDVYRVFPLEHSAKTMAIEQNAFALRIGSRPARSF
jgi:hypothetical protein